MKTFDERMMQVQALLESWQAGKPFHLIDASMHSIPKNVSEKIDELFSAFLEKENSEAIPKTRTQSGDIYQADSKKRSDEKKQCVPICRRKDASKNVEKRTTQRCWIDCYWTAKSKKEQNQQ